MEKIVKFFQNVQTEQIITSFIVIFLSILFYNAITYIFTKSEEKLVSVKGNGSSNASDHTVGEQIEIMYNPNNVEEHMIKGDNSSNIGGIIWIVLGVVILLAGIVKFLTGR